MKVRGILRWRTAGLLLAMLIIVILPYIVTLTNSRETETATEWVPHSATVKALTYQIAFVVHDSEVGCYRLLVGDGTDTTRKRAARAGEDQVGAADLLDGGGDLLGRLALAVAEMRDLQGGLEVVLVVLDRFRRDRVDVGLIAGGGIEEDRPWRSVEPGQSLAVLSTHRRQHLAGADQNDSAGHRSSHPCPPGLVVASGKILARDLIR